jgi:hypothetical protein
VKLLKAIIVAAALALSALCGTAAAAPPAQGIFDSCPLDTALPTCVQRLGVMRGGGLRVVVMPASGVSLPALAAYAAAANGLGMSVMWALSDPGWWRAPTAGADPAYDFAAFARVCGCRETALPTFVAQWLGRLPGTYGYYAADDSMLEPADDAGVAAYMAALKRGDSEHPAMIGAANSIQQRRYVGVADLVGQEIYPVTTTGFRSSWAGQTAAAVQRTASRAGKGSAFILQAFTWGDNLDDGRAIGACTASDSLASCAARLRYPSSAEQLALRDAVLRKAHPRLILWWSFQGTFGPAVPAGADQLVPTAAQVSSRWAGLAATIRARAPVSAARARARAARKRTLRARHHARLR